MIQDAPSEVTNDGLGTNHDWSRFGLGPVKLSREAEVAILTQMKWDGDSLPYPLLMEWFESTIEWACTSVAASVTPDENVVRALTESTYIKSGVPDKALD